MKKEKVMISTKCPCCKADEEVELTAEIQEYIDIYRPISYKYGGKDILKVLCSDCICLYSHTEISG